MKEKATESNAQNFTEGAIFSKLVRFMFPILGVLVLQAMYGAVDLMIVGKFGTTAGISGVSTGSSILNLATFVVAALAAGVMVLIGHYLGEKRPEKIGGLLGNAIVFFLALSLFFTVVLIVFARPIAMLMQSPAESLDLTVQYIRICGAGVVFIIFYNLISNIFRGLGDSNLPLLFVGIACVVNIAGDLILIAGFKMNVAGAAIATVGAQAVSAGKESRAKRGMAYGMLVGGSVGVVIFVLAFFKGDALARIFTDDPQVVTRAFEFLRGFAVEAIITSVLFSFLGYFNGHGWSMFVLVQGLLQSFLVRLPVSYFMSVRPSASLTGVGAAAPSATVFGIILCALYFVWMGRREKQGQLHLTHSE